MKKGEYVKAEELFVKLKKDYRIIKAGERLSDIKEILKNENNVEETVDEKVMELSENPGKSDIEMIFRKLRRCYFLTLKKQKYTSKNRKIHTKTRLLHILLNITWISLIMKTQKNGY